jgi:hypothetical protein
MKKLLLFLLLSSIPLLFTACRNDITSVVDKGTLNNVRFAKTGTTIPTYGMLCVFFENEAAGNTKLTALWNAGFRIICPSQFPDEDLNYTENGLYPNWSGTHDSMQIYTALNNGFKVVIPITPHQIQQDSFRFSGLPLKSKWTMSKVQNYLSTSKISANVVGVLIDEPQWNQYNTSNLASIISYCKSLNYKVYIAEPLRVPNDTTYSYDPNYLADADVIMYDDYVRVPAHKNSVLKNMLYSHEKSTIPLIGLMLNQMHLSPPFSYLDQNTIWGIKQDLFTAAPYCNEVWFYAETSSDPFFRLMDTASNWSAFSSFLSGLPTDHFGGWNATFLSGYGGSEATPALGDFDGDGVTDISVKTTSGNWYIDESSNGFGSPDISLSWYGGSEAIPCPAKFKNGSSSDSKSDLSVLVNDGRWLIDFSENGFGGWDLQLNDRVTSDDIPCPADFDGDGWDDLATLYTSGINDLYVHIDTSGNGYGTWDRTILLAKRDNNNNIIDAGSVIPVFGKYKDGDSKADIAILTEDGRWLIDYSSNGFGSWDVTKTGLGTSSAPCPADYDGDGYLDISVRNSSERWIICNSTSNYGGNETHDGYGDYTAILMPGDFDGDGHADMAVKTWDGKVYIDYYQLYFGALKP